MIATSKKAKPAKVSEGDTPKKAAKVSEGVKAKKAAKDEDATTDKAKAELVRKFSLGGDAWNKKLSAKRKLNSGIKSVSEIIEDEEDEGRFVYKLV